MAGKKPTYTWKFVPFTNAAPLDERKFRSKPSCYQGVEGERQKIRDGISRVVRVTVLEWRQDTGRWMTYERLDLKKEVAAEPKAQTESDGGEES